VEAELKNVLGDSPKVTEVAHGFGAACGPVCARRGYLLFCDAEAGKILKWHNGAITVLRADEGPRSLTFDHQGQLLACGKGGVTRTEKNGSVTKLATQPEAGDIIYAIDGNIYFTAGSRVYRLARNSAKSLPAADCQRPGGIALSPNQQILYVADAAGNNIRAFAIKADGSLESGRVLAEVSSGGLGGLKTDEDGRIWIAANKGVCVFNREGKPLGSVAVPRNANNLNWAEGFRNLYVTAGSAVYRIDARTNGTRTY
jgi:gluconolactonase